MHSLLGREKKEEEAGFGIGIDLGLSPGFPPHAAAMFSCVGCFWVLLSSALVAVCSFSFISPAWIVKDQLRNNNHHNQQQQQQHLHNKDSPHLYSRGVEYRASFLEYGRVCRCCANVQLHREKRMEGEDEYWSAQ
ncbi:hypothetical protein F2P81_008602 [Scophthalmus maximus]|uniref:Uncharacterized protein n=1 Tax=Scophthalmus maximus TaxID=52904 RepID=A0A6A4T1D2_SCOMX|nr:hypothetical protein F2P81_008602 [Scophthalmus maximus]